MILLCCNLLILVFLCVCFFERKKKTASLLKIPFLDEEPSGNSFPLKMGLPLCMFTSTLFFGSLYAYRNSKLHDTTYEVTFVAFATNLYLHKDLSFIVKLWPFVIYSAPPGQYKKAKSLYANIVSGVTIIIIISQEAYNMYVVGDVF
ncbi:uncharacterized protein LOC131635963 [Vicia villosa]|uniref:uncharacterized protein LOC131635963 n=1 Tax=Vicia villosa TaxID=3911 RepID=UPI00273B2AF3|nr:uncharacterized protein LOC131635963 [Vicia villosa]XP_058762582.1 uncharacterized protein LOC131635963 [Vicia villosa]